MFPLNSLLNQRSASSNCHISLYPLLPPRSPPIKCHLSPLRPLLPQGSAPLNCPMSPSTLFSLKGQHRSTVICALSTPFLIKGQHHSTVISPSTPFSLQGHHQSTVICPPPPTSPSMVSTTQRSYVPLYPLLPQRSASLNCNVPHLPSS